MPDFSNLEQLAVPRGQTSTFTFWEIEGQPSVAVLPATQDNPAYYNKFLASARKLAGRRGVNITVKTMDRDRESSYKLFSRHIARGFPCPPVDASGQAVAFSPEVCEAFLRAIPEDMYDDLRVWCSDLSNFREVADEEEIEDLEGN